MRIHHFLLITVFFILLTYPLWGYALALWDQFVVANALNPHWSIPQFSYK